MEIECDRETRRLMQVVQRWEMVVIAMLGRLSHLDDEPYIAVLDKICRGIDAIANTNRTIRLRLFPQLSKAFIQRLLGSPSLRAKVCAAIGMVAIRTWWQKYSGTFIPITRTFAGRAAVQQSRFVWKDYKLRPVPNYPEPAYERGSYDKPDQLPLISRPPYEPAIQVYPWQLDGHSEAQWSPYDYGSDDLHACHPGQGALAVQSRDLAGARDAGLARSASAPDREVPGKTRDDSNQDEPP